MTSNILSINSGLMTYITLNTLIYLTKLISGGRIEPMDEDYRDYWTCNLPNGSLKKFC